MSKPTIFSGNSPVVRDTQFNLAAPILQDNADTFSGELRFKQLSASYDNHFATGGQGQAQDEANAVNAYTKTPEEMMDSHFRRIDKTAKSKSLFPNIPILGWVAIGFVAYRLMRG